MNDKPESDLTPAERVDDIPRALRALREAVRDALRMHRLAGNPVAIWRNARVEWVQPEDIPLHDATTHAEQSER
jgi:hypothetical protein